MKIQVDLYYHGAMLDGWQLDVERDHQQRPVIRIDLALCFPQISKPPPHKLNTPKGTLTLTAVTQCTKCGRPLT